MDLNYHLAAVSSVFLYNLLLVIKIRRESFDAKNACMIFIGACSFIIAFTPSFLKAFSVFLNINFKVLAASVAVVFFVASGLLFIKIIDDIRKRLKKISGMTKMNLLMLEKAMENLSKESEEKSDDQSEERSDDQSEEKSEKKSEKDSKRKRKENVKEEIREEPGEISRGRGTKHNEN